MAKFQVTDRVYFYQKLHQTKVSELEIDLNQFSEKAQNAIKEKGEFTCGAGTDQHGTVTTYKIVK